MSQQIRVSRNIDFYGDASQESNVKGYMATDKVSEVWNFTELALDGTNKYTMELDTSSTIAVGLHGAILTTAATDNKIASIACGGLFWKPDKNPVVEMTFKLDVVTNVAIYAGWNDAVTEGAATLPFALAVATLTDTCTNGAGFLFDTDQTLDYWNVVQTNAGTDTFTQLASTYVPVAATMATVRVAVDTLGNVKYYYNGREVGYKALGVATTSLMVPFFGIKNMSGTAHIATLRRVRAWCDA